MDIMALVEEIEMRLRCTPVRNTVALRSLRREYSRRLAAISAEDVVKVASALIANPDVPRFIGDELIVSRPDALATLDRDKLEHLGSAISSWDQVDCFACCLSGPAWRQNYIEDKAIAEWARSTNRWWRRAALVSTVPLNVKARGGQGDVPRTLAICKLLIRDRDEMVVKALSWALRALVQRDPDAVRRFLEENELKLPALVIREVRQKLLTGRKNLISSKSKLSK